MHVSCERNPRPYDRGFDFHQFDQRTDFSPSTKMLSMDATYLVGKPRLRIFEKILQTWEYAWIVSLLFQQCLLLINSEMVYSFCKCLTDQITDTLYTKISQFPMKFEISLFLQIFLPRCRPFLGSVVFCAASDYTQVGQLRHDCRVYGDIENNHSQDCFIFLENGQIYIQCFDHRLNWLKIIKCVPNA